MGHSGNRRTKLEEPAPYRVGIQLGSRWVAISLRKARTQVSGSTSRASAPSDDGKLEEPAPYALVGNIQTSLRKEILHIPIAQSEPGVEPNGVSNDFRWKAVTFEGDGVHPKRLHLNHQIEIRALNVTMPRFAVPPLAEGPSGELEAAAGTIVLGQQIDHAGESVRAVLRRPAVP